MLLCGCVSLLPTIHSRDAYHPLTMKFTLAVSVLALAASSEAFSPLASPRSVSSALKMAEATQTKKYTFTKSEEIFAEAKEVRMNKGNSALLVARCTSLVQLPQEGIGLPMFHAYWLFANWTVHVALPHIVSLWHESIRTNS